ncbi:fungal specific transcription factor domain protein [Fusarium beomiforme]|uniref:Fungal specific transcription factor domain protein n=1 Tax=Fusarium beomiforme TaxID=44412 RepID=A0A9P5AL65_9HYPO|nr:fungal specific transcription factor domain protein [Fusarium beomiforme]
MLQKKFRCSKELPKCSACKPWPSACTYSRDKPATKPDTSKQQEVPGSSSSARRDDGVWIHDRLENVEKRMQVLTNCVGQLVERLNAQTSTSRQQAADKADDTQTPVETRESTPKLALGKSNTFTFLEDKSINTATVGSSSLHQLAANELQYLSNSLTTAVEDRTQPTNDFYVPSRSEGYQMIGRFLGNASLGDAFFLTPSEELLIQIVFGPDTVSRKAWVVYVNYMILTMLADHEGTKAQMYRGNMKLALNDSSIFLEPHEVNLQALTVLAIHGEDYASPNMSWMLVGHACRQVEALGLYASSKTDLETYNRRLSLFWLLFAVDKSCALAFGRPCFLASEAYSHIPLPDLGYLTRIQPHIHSTDTNKMAGRSMFGAYLFLASLELAKVIGNVLESQKRGHGTATEELRERLEAWHIQTYKVLKDILEGERPLSSQNQIREMELGISTIKFEYLHTLMALLMSHPPSKSIRLGAAREAIAILPSMVSNWTSVYNGMIWHLLYFPFTAYFVIFENLVQNHAQLSAVTTQQDFDLLFTTASYYTSMRDQMQILAPLCVRLENIATVFLRLAQMHVGYPNSLHTGGPLVQQSARASSSQNKSALNKGSAMSMQEAQVELRDEMGIDLEQYLQWNPTDVFSSQDSRQEDIPARTLDQELPHIDSGDQLNKEPRGTKRPFDVMFDWFAWDVYYGENKEWPKQGSDVYSLVPEAML